MTSCAAHDYDSGVHCVSDDERGEALAFCSTLTAEKLQGLTVDEAAGQPSICTRGTLFTPN